MSVLRSATAAGLIALALAGATLTSVTVANAAPISNVLGNVKADASTGAIVAPIHSVAYHHPHCSWVWQKDHHGHKHKVKVCR